MLKKEINKKVRFYKSIKHPVVSDKDLQLHMNVHAVDVFLLKKVYAYYACRLKDRFELDV